ncbi:hypothetical protein D9758_010591 [Tetrapyrgos nigripes]|uniref:Uncharacterized protein n=1 Tax=Tetrapyrgos nigripes TaxID=182062 RepID=A0A8H5D5A6_9AGAR|nr:hypothetical protein D9758_010591 [Tetrapyrgos nigripes]
MSSQAEAQWTEPPWSGWIETTGDALLILEAARRGLIPRVNRRLVDNERKMIASGSVFVFDEKESGIKRWTDGFFWSPSRILGNFLLYRETDKRGCGHRGRGEGDDSPPSQTEYPTGGSSLSRPRTDTNMLGLDKMRERSLMGSLTNSYKFKSDGLMKKTFSLHVDGAAQHLISYYRIEDVESGRLRSPSSLPELASLDISPELLDKTHFRNPPKVEVGPDGIPRYRGEADDIDPSPTILSAPLSTGLPLLTDGRHTTDKRSTKRFDPYGPPPTSKRRKAKETDDPSASASGSTAQQQPQAQPLLQAPQPYPDPNQQMMQSQPSSQSQGLQQPLPHQATASTTHPYPHHHPYATPYPVPSNMPMGYYSYHGHTMYSSPYPPPGTSGSPIPAVPPSAQSSPSPPVPSSSTSTTPTPATVGGIPASPTNGSPTAVTDQSAGGGSSQSPVGATPVPYAYTYPHPQSYSQPQATVDNTGAVDPNANVSVSPTQPQAQSQSQSTGASQVQSQAQNQPQLQAQSSTVPTVTAPPGAGAAPAVSRPIAGVPVHPSAYYPYYPPPGIYQPYHVWYGYVPGHGPGHGHGHVLGHGVLGHGHGQAPGHAGGHMQHQQQQQQHQAQAQLLIHTQPQVQGKVPVQVVQMESPVTGRPIPESSSMQQQHEGMSDVEASDTSTDGMD